MTDALKVAAAIFVLVLIVLLALIFKPALGSVPLFAGISDKVVIGGALAVLGYYFVMSHKDPTP